MQLAGLAVGNRNKYGNQYGRGSLTKRLAIGGVVAGLACGLICAQQQGKVSAKTAEAVTEWVRNEAIPLASAAPASGLKDMEPLGAVVGDARIVAMGEATHGTREFFQLKHRMLEYLVKQKGFTIFGIEANWPESLVVNDYVLNGSGDPQEAVNGLHLLTANTEELLELIRWMREYNEDPKHVQKVKFCGFDGQTAYVAVRNFLKYLEKVDPEGAKAAAKILNPISDAEKEKTATRKPGAFWDVEEDRVQGLLKQVESKKENYVRESSQVEWVMAQHNLEIVKQAVDLYAIKRQGNVSPRDLAMAKNVRWILEREGSNAKIMLWAHNGHVSTGMLGGGASMGNELRQMYGNQMLVCGFSFDQGWFEAYQKGKGARPFTVGPAPADTVDGVLAATGIPLFAVDLRRTPAGGAVDGWLRTPQKMRSIGAMYSENWPDGGFSEVTPRDFDVLFFVRQTTAVRESTRTVRTAE